METHAALPLTVFYDGACRVCSMEMAHLQKHARDSQLTFINIALPSFRPEAHGRTMAQFMAKMHVRDGNGRFFTGIDAFIQIRSAFPSKSVTGIVGRVLGLPVVNPVAKVGYRVFARYRHLLPKQEVRCDSGQCQR